MVELITGCRVCGFGATGAVDGEGYRGSSNRRTTPVLVVVVIDTTTTTSTGAVDGEGYAHRALHEEAVEHLHTNAQRKTTAPCLTSHSCSHSSLMLDLKTASVQ